MRFDPCFMCTGLILVCAAADVAQAHHSQAGFDNRPEAVETLTGTVTQFDFKNPHVYLYLQTQAADGSTALWELEATSTPNLLRRGWNRDTVKPGDVVTIDIHPAVTPGLLVARVGTLHLADGRKLSATTGDPVAPPNARATSLAGRWLGRSRLAQVQLNLVQWPLTPKGQAALDRYDGTQNPQVECIPMTAPGIMLYSPPLDIRLEQDRMIVNGEWLSYERVIYLDGRAHPPSGERRLQGHSVGHWEGATLVVDTTQFADHGAGNAFEIPSGARKHLIERFSLSDDGKRIDYAFVLEDPEYMTAPIVGDGAWEYRPDLELHQVDCDPEISHRFMERLLPQP